MGLSALFEKLINEHGSSTILKERIAAFKDQLIDLENENESLESENAVLKSQINDLQKQKTEITKDKEVCQAQLDKIHSICLNENHEKVLISVASHSGQYPEVLSKVSGLSVQEVTAKLNYLSSLGLLHYQVRYLIDQNQKPFSSREVNIWFISKPGHAYIKANNLNEKIA